MDFIEYLNQNYLLLVPALWILGFAIKQTPFIPDWLIIWIILLVSIVFGTIAFGFSFEGLINGVVAAGVAVLGHQMLKQTLNGNDTKSKKNNL